MSASAFMLVFIALSLLVQREKKVAELREFVNNHRLHTWIILTQVLGAIPFRASF